MAQRLGFGVNLSTSAAPGADPVADARHAEALGFDFLTVTDHLHGSHDTYETWTLLTWVAAATERIGLVTNVLGLPYRPPPVVAKMAESLDRLSGGRLVLGLGMGGSDAEFQAFGLPVRSPREKVQALTEAIEIIRGVWSQPAFSYRGRHFHTEGARIEPKAARHIPIWLGTYGPKGLALTGRTADGWSVSRMPPETIAGMRERMMEAASEGGRQPDEIVCNYNLAVLVDERATPREGAVAGSPQAVTERLADFVGAGITSFNIVPLGDEREQRERLAREVRPALQAAISG